MVWDGITMMGSTDLHVCQGRVAGVYYRVNVLAPYVVPFARRHGRGFVFQDNNARAHRAKDVMNYLQRRNIRSLPWPAMSWTCHQSNTFGTSSGDVFEELFLNRGPWVILVQRCNINGIGSVRSPYVDLLGACVVAALLVMTIEAGSHVFNDV